MEQPLLYYRNNVGGSVGLLETLLEFGPLPFVFSSSCAIYGLPEQVPIGEDHPQRPINPYGFSKLVVERMLADLGTSTTCPGRPCAISMPAGADPGGEIGEAHSPRHT